MDCEPGRIYDAKSFAQNDSETRIAFAEKTASRSSTVAKFVFENLEFPMRRIIKQVDIVRSSKVNIEFHFPSLILTFSKKIILCWLIRKKLFR